MIISEQRRYIEIVAVILTGIGKFLFMDWLGIKFSYIIVACLFWLTYVFYRFKENSAILVYWGMSKQQFKKTFFELLPIGISSVILFIFIGNQLDTNVLNWTITPILLLYPIWGIIQQFIMIGIIARNLKDIEQINIPAFIIVLLTAFLFSIVHYPSLLLMVGTFFLALVYTILYLNNRNLIAMGIYHGWLGAFFYATILGRDPWQEIFGAF